MKIQRWVAALFATFLATTAVAQNAVLINEWVKAGVNQTTGTFGSGGNTSPGLQYDGTGSGTFNAAYDYLTPGSPFDGFTVRIEDSANALVQSYTNNNAGNQAGITGAWVGSTSSSSAIWEGSNSRFTLRNIYSLPSGQQYVDINTTITASESIANLYFGRFIDPDARAAAGDSSSTDNVRGYGAIPRNNVAFSEALASRYALGLYTGQTTGSYGSGISPGWSTDPRDYLNNTSGQDAVRGDYTIGLGFRIQGLSVGDIVSIRYAYIFGPSAFGAASSAVTGGAGGGTPGTTPSGGTLTDVGSATDASSSSPPAGSGPTVTGTSAATITVSDVSVVNTSLPVIVASVAHHTATEASGQQTIARETTTNTTTPYTRTVTTLTRTTTTYSDSTTTVSDSATTSTSSLVNVVDTAVTNESFSGRIDQMTELGNLNTGINRYLNMNAFRKDGYRNESGAVYINANRMSSGMSNGYSATTRIYGLALETTVDKDWRVGAQYNRADTTMSGVDSSTTQGKNAAGVYSIYNWSDWIIVNNLGYAENGIASNRNVAGIFTNSHNTSSTDMWLNNRVYTPSHLGFRPFAGYTVGRSITNGYTEHGSIQSYRTVGATKTTTNYGEAGVMFDQRMDGFIMAAEASTTTDNFTTATAVLGYEVDQSGMIAITGTHQRYFGVRSNIVGIQGIFRF